MTEHEARIKERYTRLAGTLDERGRRAVAAAEALALGFGGISAVSRATGLSRTVIYRGIDELTGAIPRAAPGRIRRPGGGRKKTTERDPSVLADLERLVEPTTRGDPASALRWTCKSVRKLAAALREQGHRVSHQWVAGALHDLGYSRRGTRKTREGEAPRGYPPDRDAQFAHINTTAQAFLAAGDPVLSVDTKTTELGGGRQERGAGVAATG